MRTTRRCSTCTPDRTILTGHVVTATGTSSDDVYHVQMDDTETFIKIWENTAPTGTPTFTMHKDAIAGLIFDLGAGIDAVRVTAAVLNYLLASGKFIDLRDNSMIVDYSAPNPSPLPTVKLLLINGYNGGMWNGSGIRTSLGNASTYALGYAENDNSPSGVNFSSFAGQVVDSTTVLIKYTFYGDANLDGSVNLPDFNRLAANFGTLSGAVWAQGDFDFDGDVDLTDFNLLSGNFGQFGLGPGGGGGTYGYTVQELLYHLLHGGHGLLPR